MEIEIIWRSRWGKTRKAERVQIETGRTGGDKISHHLSHCAAEFKAMTAESADDPGAFHSRETIDNRRAVWGILEKAGFHGKHGTVGIGKNLPDEAAHVCLVFGVGLAAERIGIDG